MNIKNILAVAAISAIGTAAIAQPYVKAFGGYSRGTAGSNVGNTVVITTTGYSQKAVTGTYGNFIGGGLGFGYGINEHVALELGVTYGAGKTTQLDETNPAGTTSIISKSTQIRVIPAVVISAGGSLSPYGRFGLVLPVGGSTNTEIDAKSAGAAAPGITYSNVTTGTIESKGQFSVGFNGALGASFKLSDNLSLFAEVETTTLSIAGKSNTYTAYNSTTTFSSVLPTDTETLAEWTTSQKETVFVDEITNTSNTEDNDNFDEKKPTEELRDRSNYSSFGVNVGVKFGF